MEVPITITILLGVTTVVAGTAAWASTFPTATAVPGLSPNFSAMAGVSPPARLPWGRIVRDIFSSTMSARRGSNAAKNSRLGKPSRLLQMALYPAVHALRVSTPVSCQITQSVASMSRSAAS